MCTNVAQACRAARRLRVQTDLWPIIPGWDLFWESLESTMSYNAKRLSVSVPRPVSTISVGCRSSSNLYANRSVSVAASALWRLPLVYLVMNIIRICAITGQPLSASAHQHLTQHSTSVLSVYQSALKQRLSSRLARVCHDIIFCPVFEPSSRSHCTQQRESRVVEAQSVCTCVWPSHIVKCVL